MKCNGVYGILKSSEADDGFSVPQSSPGRLTHASCRLFANARVCDYDTDGDGREQRPTAVSNMSALAHRSGPRYLSEVV